MESRGWFILLLDFFILNCNIGRVCGLIVVMKNVPEEIERYRDKKWRREETLKISNAADVEALVEEVGFCNGLTDSRTNMPSVYYAVCGRRDAHAPKNVQKDAEMSLAWVLKDEVMQRGNVYYAKLVKGRAMFVAPRLIPFFSAIHRFPKSKEKKMLSDDAFIVLKILRREWESSTADLRADAKFKDRKQITRALEELQRCLKVLPYEVLYKPKFTYLWTLAEARFADQLGKRIKRETAIIELTKVFLNTCGLVSRAELSKAIGVSAKEAKEALNLVEVEGFAKKSKDAHFVLNKL